MRQVSKRLAVPAILASLLMGMLGAVALASAPWNGTCNWGELCNYYDQSFNGPIAAMAGSNSSYHDETYPGITWGVNDSASSVKNLLSTQRVKWRHEVDYQGGGICIQPGYQTSFVGLGSNDAFTSHLVTSNAC